MPKKESPNPTPLTQKEVNNLRNGTKVQVIWSGGNGPWTYIISRDKSKRVIATYGDVFVGYLDRVGVTKGNDRVYLFGAVKEQSLKNIRKKGEK